MSASPARICAVSLAAFTFAATVFVPFRAPRIAANPGQAPTATATSTPSPVVVGSVTLRLVGDPNACFGLQFEGVFTATSPVAPVGEMRALFDPLSAEACDDIRVDIDEAPWEQFVDKRTYGSHTGYHQPFGVALGAQYRDAAGNVSPVYCEWIYGICMPTPTLTPRPTHTPAPTPTPTAWRAYAPLASRHVPRPSPTPLARPGALWR
jgi:hypothetical protein